MTPKPQGDEQSEAMLALAETIHKARWAEDRQTGITPFADEDRRAREYCFRIARAVLAARPASNGVREALERVVGHDPKVPGLSYDSVEQLLSSAAQACREALAALSASPDEAREVTDLHPDTQDLVRKISWALEDKLHRAEKKYGYSNNWLTDNWEAECRRQLKLHLEKGDPLDVVAYAAFMWARGWSTNKPSAALAQPVAPERGE